jgi:hypothetical protein
MGKAQLSVFIEKRERARPVEPDIHLDGFKLTEDFRVLSDRWGFVHETPGAMISIDSTLSTLMQSRLGHHVWCDGRWPGVRMAFPSSGLNCSTAMKAPSFGIALCMNIASSRSVNTDSP